MSFDIAISLEGTCKFAKPKKDFKGRLFGVYKARNFD